MQADVIIFPSNLFSFRFPRGIMGLLVFFANFGVYLLGILPIFRELALLSASGSRQKVLVQIYYIMALHREQRIAFDMLLRCTA